MQGKIPNHYAITSAPILYFSGHKLIVVMKWDIVIPGTRLWVSTIDKILKETSIDIVMETSHFDLKFFLKQV